MKILVVGGAGYIGSICSELLLDSGYDVAVLDNLTEGHRRAIDPRAQFIQGDVAAAVTELRSGPDTLMINGSASLVNYLTRHNLIDEYRIMVYPVVVGEGRKLWDEGTKVALKLTRTWTTKTGVAVLTYVPA